MKKNSYRVKCALCFVFACMALASCKDNDYDLSYTDATVGVGGDTLQVPTSSTKYITMGDLIDLRGNDLVHIDHATGNYLMEKSDHNVKPITITVPGGATAAPGGGNGTGYQPESAVCSFGEVTIEHAPEFLAHKDAVLKLDNPQFILTIKSDMPVGGTVSGDLNSYDEAGKKIATVHIDGLRIEKSGTSTICICRHADGIDATGYTQVKEVSNLADIMPVVPHRMRFDASVKADDMTDVAAVAGKTYTITPTFRFTAPLTFQEGTTLVFVFVENGWNRDFRKLSLMDDAYMSATVNADNGMPQEMEVSVVAIDVEGKPISRDRIEINVDRNVAASPDGVKRVVTPAKLRMDEKVDRAMHDIDGMQFTFKGHPSAGIQLNAITHTLKMDDIKVYFIGKLVADFNI